MQQINPTLLDVRRATNVSLLTYSVTYLYTCCIIFSTVVVIVLTDNTCSSCYAAVLYAALRILFVHLSVCLPSVLLTRRKNEEKSNRCGIFHLKCQRSRSLGVKNFTNMAI